MSEDPNGSPYPGRPLSLRVLRRSEVTMLAAMYFPLMEVDNAVNVAELESSFNTAAWNNHAEDSRGIWQINVASGAHAEIAVWNLFDPMLNAYFAAQIWKSSGWRAWFNSATKLHLL